MQDNPKNSSCEDGWRFIPIEVTDLPGLIKGAWMGKGLGNQFLSVAAQSDALLHVVDASGSVDKDGRSPKRERGTRSLTWLMSSSSSSCGTRSSSRATSRRLSKTAKLPGVGPPRAVAEVMQGIGVKKEHVTYALKESLLEGKEIESWNEKEVQNFCWILRDVSKPTLIIANKMDVPNAAENFQKLREHTRT